MILKRECTVDFSSNAIGIGSVSEEKKEPDPMHQSKEAERDKTRESPQYYLGRRETAPR